jgi:uncharacterized protein YecE (DUF72 family)
MFVVAMKFGKLPSIDHLSADFFVLPPTRWASKNESKKTQVFAGGTSWNISQWVGTAYAPKTPRRLWPEAYGKLFGTIEFNATHYRIYSPEKMQEWAEATPEGFKFCCKFPQIITHFRRFKNCDGPTDDFIAGLLALGSRLGPSFIQLPPHFAPKHADAFWTYLEKWPQELPLTVEFRHPDWFLGNQEHWSRLAELNVGSVISDTAGRRDALHMQVTAPHILVRFGGYEGHPTDGQRLNDWAEWISTAELKGVSSFYMLIHEPDSLATPATASNFRRAVNEINNKPVKAPDPVLRND